MFWCVVCSVCFWSHKWNLTSYVYMSCVHHLLYAFANMLQGLYSSDWHNKFWRMWKVMEDTVPTFLIYLQELRATMKTQTAALTHPPPTRFHGLTLTKDLTTAARHWTVPHEEVHVSDVSVLYSNNWTTLYSFDASSTALFNRCFSCCKIEELNSDTLTSQ